MLGTTDETHKNPHMMVENGGESHSTIRKKNNQKKHIASLSHVFGIHLKVLKACIQTSEIVGNKKTCLDVTDTSRNKMYVYMHTS